MLEEMLGPEGGEMELQDIANATLGRAPDPQAPGGRLRPSPQFHPPMFVDEETMTTDHFSNLTNEDLGDLLVQYNELVDQGGIHHVQQARYADYAQYVERELNRRFTANDTRTRMRVRTDMIPR
jgi:hypothetical protein